MATRQSIEFDYNRACSQASSLDNIANNLKTLSNNKLSGSMQNLSVNWTGKNAKAYIAKGDMLKNNIVATANALNKIASDIRTIAKKIHDTEMYNLELAERREYYSNK